MFFEKKRICNTCGLEKSLERDFCKDVKGRNGHAASCRDCKNKARRERDAKKVIPSKKPEKVIPIVGDMKIKGVPVKVTIKKEPVYNQVTTLKAISDKYKCHWNISCKGENAVLQIHSYPVNFIIKGTIESVIEQAMKYKNG